MATVTPDRSGRDSSYRGRFQYGGDRYGLEFEHLVVEENFNPEIGFTRRENLEQSLGKVRFSPRPRSIEAIRKFTFETGVDYIENGSGCLSPGRSNFSSRPSSRWEIRSIFHTGATTSSWRMSSISLMT